MRVVAPDGGRLRAVRWAFGDDSEDTGAEASHRWRTAGQYTVSAQVTLADGRRAMPTTRITVVGGPVDDQTTEEQNNGDPQDPRDPQKPDDPQKPGDPQNPGDPKDPGDPQDPGDPDQRRPTARLTLSYEAGGSAVSALDVVADASRSTPGSADIASYAFDFTGQFGNAQPGATANHTYDEPPGSITVRVRVTDRNGQTSEATATVSGQRHRLEVAFTGDGGRVSGPDQLFCPDACGATLRAGQSVTLTAQADSDATFDGWTGDCAGQSGTQCHLTMDGPRNAGATFTRQVRNRTLSVTVSGPGRVTGGGISCPGTCSVTIAAGESVNLTATGDGGNFDGWSGDCTGAAACTLTMDGDHAAGASFTDPLTAALRWQDAAGTAPSPPISAILDASGSRGAVSYNFDYGDGTSTGWQSSPRTPAHSYPLRNGGFDRNSTWTPRVTVRDGQGREKTAQTSITVHCC
nr:PKD domain-containing protein [Frankia gtarii]